MRLRSNRWTALLVGSLVVAALGRSDSTRAETARSASTALPVEQETLPNGLTVVLAPDRSVSTVRVLVRYRGGAADEPKGREGFTHLVERLFGEGTVHTKAGEHEQRIDAAGGWTTSATTLDDLTLSTEVPPGALELALFLEAERLAGLADGITDAGLARARDAIASEYRAAYVEQPYGLVARATRDALWPEGHGNRHDVLGDGASLARASTADVRAFVRERIEPAHATVVVVGNFALDTTTALVRRYFGWLPRRSGSGAAAVRDAASNTAPHTAALTAPVERAIGDSIPRVVVAYRTPAGHTSEVELQLLARVLAGSATSRLERTLVDSGRASEVRADLVPHAHGGSFEVHATPAPGADPKRLAADIRVEVLSLATSPPSADVLEAIRTTVYRERLVALESLAGRSSTSDEWGNLGSIGVYVAALRERIDRVTPEDIQTLARTWLSESSAVTILAGPEAR